ncbi:MAG: hypothetical protein ACLSE6_01635 [Alphaproteobacteria bacterium]
MGLQKYWLKARRRRNGNYGGREELADLDDQFSGAGYRDVRLMQVHSDDDDVLDWTMTTAIDLPLDEEDGLEDGFDLGDDLGDGLEDEE